MDLRLVCVVACLCALALASAEVQLPKCCVKTRDVRISSLQRISRIVIQESTGACDIDAIVIYTKGRKSPTCANPNVSSKLKEYLDRLCDLSDFHPRNQRCLKLVVPVHWS